MHTVFMSGCDKWQDWEAIGLYWSFIRAGQPGEITRLIGCDFGRDLIHRKVFWVMPTWVTPGVQRVGDDDYLIYNKPWVLKQWFVKAKPVQDYYLVLDSDMTIHRPFLPTELQVGPGWAAAENIWYLQDMNNVLAGELFPELTERFDDWLAHPGPGRVADEVAEFYFLHREDAGRVAKLYWEYTLPIRKFMIDPSEEGKLRRNKTTGDIWVSETHAYPIAAAASGVRHHGYNNSMFHTAHPIYDAAPNALHYPWPAEVDALGWSWYKHDYHDFDLNKCPPWSNTRKSTGGLFPHPPLPSLLQSKGGQLARDLLNIEIVAMLNQGLCHFHHLKFCPKSEDLLEQCGKADQVMAELEERWAELKMEVKGDLFCIDAYGQEDCDCETDPGNCRRTCGLCTPREYP
ncbi:g6637 [Coccomyxa elongata]